MRAPMVAMPHWLSRTVTLAVMSAVLLWVGGPGSAHAQIPASSTAQERPDVRVVVDVSGSMKANDPNRLSSSALDMLVALLPGEVSAGIWTFGERVDNPLPLAPVTAEWRENALRLPPALQNYQQYTDIEAALRTASAVDGNGWRHVVLLTDGVIDLPSTRGTKPAIDIASRARVLDAMSPDLVRQGVVVHAIAFSAGADVAMVERLAQQTGGLAAVVETPEALLGAFLDIVGRIFPAEQVPLDDDGSFVIDDSVNDFSALVFHDPDDGDITLVAPDGTRYSRDNVPDEISWQHEPRFDLIRVPDAQQGEWRIEGAMGANSRITVSGDQRLVTGALPSTLYTGFEVPLEAWLESPEEATAPEELTVTATLSGEAFKAPVNATLQRRGKHFSGMLPAPTAIGNARLVIDARGESFHRQRVQAVNILPAIGAVVSDDRRHVELVAEHPGLNRGNTVLSGDLLGVPLVVEPVGRQRWEIALPETDEQLRQPLVIEGQATLDGREHRWKLPTLWLNADGSVSIDRAAAGPTLVGERLTQQAEEAAGQRSAEALADRFVELVNNPRLVVDWARQTWPTVKTRATDPRVWIGLAVLVLVLVVWSRWRRRRASGPTREEPHV
ncbi:TIGR03503 family protein [Halomonas cupida]|nr:TIGR03503 family protein [Halomonas cupida]